MNMDILKLIKNAAGFSTISAFVRKVCTNSGMRFNSVHVTAAFEQEDHLVVVLNDGTRWKVLFQIEKVS